MTDLSTGQETRARVSLCPKCNSPSVEQQTLGILHGPDTNKAWCSVCDWKGIADDLTIAEFKHEMGSNENIVLALTNEMRTIIARYLAGPAGSFLLKWGFIQQPVDRRILARYMGAIARAVLTSIIEEREKIEKEKP